MACSAVTFSAGLLTRPVRVTIPFSTATPIWAALMLGSSSSTSMRDSAVLDRAYADGLDLDTGARSTACGWPRRCSDPQGADVVLAGGMGGRALAEEAARRRPGLKVLFTTGYTSNAIVHHRHTSILVCG